MNLTAYATRFPSLRFDEPGESVLGILLAAEGRLNAADAGMHAELAAVWRAIDADADVNAVLVRGAGELGEPARREIAADQRREEPLAGLAHHDGRHVARGGKGEHAVREVAGASDLDLGAKLRGDLEPGARVLRPSGPFDVQGDPGYAKRRGELLGMAGDPLAAGVWADEGKEPLTAAAAARRWGRAQQRPRVPRRRGARSAAADCRKTSTACRP